MNPKRILSFRPTLPFRAKSMLLMMRPSSAESLSAVEKGSDALLSPGLVIHARASLINRPRLCQQLYGTSWRTVLVTGTVIPSYKKRSGRQARNMCRRCTILDTGILNVHYMRAKCFLGRLLQETDLFHLLLWKQGIETLP